jgi:DNA repair protein RadC
MSHPHSLADSATGTFFPLSVRQEEDAIIRRAIDILERRVFQFGPLLDRPEAVADYLRLQLGAEPDEVFAVLFLNQQHRALAFERLFKGSVNQVSVYPRVVVRQALLNNSTGVIVCHVHPSGATEPSAADREFTKNLSQALATLEIRLLDHFIIGQGSPYSFAAHGLL